MKTPKSFWNIPNILSLYRIVIFPFILFLIISKRDQLFIVFLLINLFTDILDGFIARRFNMQTEIGAKLDSYADIGTYILAFLGVFIFKWDVIKPDKLILIIFFTFYCTTLLYALIKFKRPASLHLYLFKTTGYLQGTFIGVLFLIGYFQWLFYLALCVGILACIESMIFITILKEPKSNVKGLYCMFKKR